MEKRGSLLSEPWRSVMSGTGNESERESLGQTPLGRCNLAGRQLLHTWNRRCVKQGRGCGVLDFQLGESHFDNCSAEARGRLGPLGAPRRRGLRGSRTFVVGGGGGWVWISCLRSGENAQGKGEDREVRPGKGYGRGVRLTLSSNASLAPCSVSKQKGADGRQGTARSKADLSSLGPVEPAASSCL